MKNEEVILPFPFMGYHEPLLKNKKTTQQSQEILFSNSKQLSFKGIGWKFKIQKKGTNYVLSLPKEVIIGNVLLKGDELYSYLVDCNGRKALITFLDGDVRDKEEVSLLDPIRI